MGNYLPNTPKDIAEMLSTIGVQNIDDLFAEIPSDLRMNRPLNLPDGLSEPEMLQKLSVMSDRNRKASDSPCFIGAGAYDHYIPAAIDHLLLRGEFFTAYTPYQAEISQGTLQAIYEFQSLICSLTEMDAANASMYDGATALAEAINMAIAQTGRKKVLLSTTVHPEYRSVIDNISCGAGAEIIPVTAEDGCMDFTKFARLIDDSIAAVVTQYPNFFGCIEDIEAVSEKAHSVGALSIVSTNPTALAFLTPPGKLGADIVTGEGQPLGIPLSFGGPYIGFLAATKSLLRRIPGRIAGAAKDSKGRRGFVLTLQAREQHIRREKAGSNICSNQALMALCATIYLSLLGPDGLRDVAMQCFQKAHYLKQSLETIPKISFPFSGSFFHEFVFKVPDAAKILQKMARHGFFGGVLLETWDSNLKNHVLVSVTEKRTLSEIDAYVQTIGGLLS